MAGTLTGTVGTVRRGGNALCASPHRGVSVSAGDCQQRTCFAAKTARMSVFLAVRIEVSATKQEGYTRKMALQCFAEGVGTWK